MKKFLHNISTNWILLIIILQPILDILAYFSFDTKITLISFTARTLILVFTVFYSFFVSLNKKRFILKLSPIFIFSLLHIVNSYRVGYLSIFTDIRYLILVVQFPIITICLIDYLKNHNEEIVQIKYGFIINILIIFISVLLSVFTNTCNMTYEGYGLTGWFASENTQSMILSITCPIFIYYFNKNSRLFRYIISNFIVIFLLFFNGTRACFITLLFIFLLMIYNSLFEKNRKMKIYKFIISVLLLILIVFSYNFSNTFTRGKLVKENNEKIEENVKKELENEKLDFKNLSKEDVIKILNTSYYYRELIDIFGKEKVYNEMKDKMSYSVLADNRVRKQVCAKLISEDLDLITRFVGFEFTKIGQYSMDLENDFTAIYYYYGYLGFSLYILFILYFVHILFKNFIKYKKIIFNPEFVIICGTLGLILIGSEFSGAFLRKPNANIYLAFLLVIIYFKYYFKINELKDNKITIMALHLKPGGVEKFISTTSSFLSKKYDVEIACVYEYEKNQIVDLNKKVKVKYLLPKKYKPNREIIKSKLASKKYLSVLKELILAIKVIILKNIKMIQYIEKCDSSIIISTRWDHNKILSKYSKLGVLKVVTEHNYYSNKYSKKVVNSCNDIDYFVVSTDDQRNYYDNLFKGTKTKIIKIPFALENIPKNSSKLDNYNLISVGRLSKEKGFDDMINIFSELSKKDSRFTLKIIGYGDEEEDLLNQIKQLRLEKKVTLCGRKNSKEIQNELLESSLFLLTSHTESFGIVLIEAMSCGVPCIIFDDAKGALEIVKNDYNGFVIEDRDSKEYVQTILNLFNDKKKLKELGLNAKEKSKEFDIKKITEEWLSLLENESR